jgi:outer membrane receptor protein involved in Fe transport
MIARFYIAALCLGATSASAADEIVVTATRLPPTKGEVSYAVTTIDSARLGSSASNRIDDALRREAGFQMFRRTSSAVINASTQGVTLRGLGGNASSRALVTLDGTPLADPFGGWIPWSALALDDIGNVRITRGGGAVAAGEGALSGAIELSSAAVPKGLSGHGTLAYGSFNSIEASDHLNWQEGKWAVSFSALARRSDGYRLIAAEQAGPVDIPAASRSRSINGRISYALDPTTHIEVSGLLYDEAKSNGFVVSNNSDRGADFALRFLHQPTHGWALEAIGWHKSRNFSSGFASADATRSIVTLNSIQDAVPATGSGTRIELRPMLPKGWTLRLGGEGRWSAGETDERFLPVAGVFTKARVAGGKQQVIGGFAELSASPLPALTLTAGGRFDAWESTQGRRTERLISSNAITLDTAYPDRNGSEWTGRAGAQLKLSEIITLRAAAYSGWRLPTLNELYRPFRVGTISTDSNAALTPEHLRGADAGLVLTPSKNWGIELTGFANYLDDAIINATISTAAGGVVNQQRQNVPHVSSLGIEAAAHGALGAGISFDGSLIFADATVRSPSALAGKHLAETPQLQGSLTLAWRAPKDLYFAAVTLRHTASAFDDDLNTRTLTSATTLDASFSVQVSPLFRLTLRAENIADTRIVSALSATGVQSIGTPRLIMVGAGMAF